MILLAAMMWINPEENNVQEPFNKLLFVSILTTVKAKELKSEKFIDCINNLYF